jgi:hypothetical protein
MSGSRISGGDGPFVSRGVDPMTGHPAQVVRNRDQRVRGQVCAGCGGPLFRASRGPVPRWCPACDQLARRRRQLRAYLRSASRIAGELGLADVASLAMDAVTAVDRGWGA